MAKLIFGMKQSLDGYIAGVAGGRNCRRPAEVEGDIDVAGPELAGSLTDLGLIDEYRLYFRPFVLGRGKPYFAGARPPLRLVATDLVGEDAVRLKYVPA
jgi:dihydrofolate reductase